MATPIRSEQDQQPTERADACVHAQLQARGSVAGETSPRAVTTGGKMEAEGVASRSHAGKPIDLETGEPLDLVATGLHSIKVTRHPVPDPSMPGNRAQIDALAFSVSPPEGESHTWLVKEMKAFLSVEHLEQRNGRFGFKYSLRFGDGAGLFAWGGKSQRSRLYFSILGKGCAMVQDWAGLAAWLLRYGATIKRADVAYDDFSGSTISIAWALCQYESGGFNAGGRKPQHQVFGDWLCGDQCTKGRTLAVGSRTSGKYCRIYEKGKQLGDPASPWCRAEVEWHGKDRLIPVEILTQPAKYLAGAYPCLAVLSVEQQRIKTIANSATISFESAMDHARLQTGKLVNQMLRVFGGDVGEVVERLRRDGIPHRLTDYSQVLGSQPELLDPEAPGSFQASGLIE